MSIGSLLWGFKAWVEWPPFISHSTWHLYISLLHHIILKLSAWKIKLKIFNYTSICLALLLSGKLTKLRKHIIFVLVPTQSHSATLNLSHQPSWLAYWSTSDQWSLSSNSLSRRSNEVSPAKFGTFLTNLPHRNSQVSPPSKPI